METNKRRSRKPIDRAISYQSTFSTDEGSKVLLDLMKEHHMLNNTFCKDPYDSAFKEGERSVVLRIMQIMNINVDQLSKKIEEAVKQSEAYNQ